MRTIGNILWFLFGGLIGGLSWVLQDVSGVLQSSEFQSDCSALSLLLWHSGRSEKILCMETVCFHSWSI